MRRAFRSRSGGPGTRPGFTLIELLIVLAIIGLVVGLILVAALDGVRQAEERATQSLIAKLELGVNERYQALMGERAEPNGAHQFLASIMPPLSPAQSNPPNAVSVWGAQGNQRAAVIARYDQIKAEMPDVFFVDMQSFPQYPINFAGMPYGNPTFQTSYALPLGNAVSPPYDPQSTYDPNSIINLGPGAAPDPNVQPVAAQYYNYAGTGIFGASYVARGAINKNLGYLPQGFDLIDNNGNGSIDELAEGIGNDPVIADPDSPIAGTTIHVSALIQRRLGNHTHNTARSEALYAFLVEGIGPLGSVFSRDDFTEREVQDTDGDGLPEFVDAWGHPLQFYRWPIFYQDGGLQPLGSSTSAAPTYYYRSGIQKGINPQGFDGIDNDNQNGPDDPVEVLVYNGPLGINPAIPGNIASGEPRQQNPLDPNQQLLAPGWWWSGSNVRPPFVAYLGGPSSIPISAPAFVFSNFYHTLIDFTRTAGSQPGFNWDPGGFYPRGAYFSKFLIASGGPDESLGIGQLNASYPSGSGVPFPVQKDPVGNTSLLIAIENTAARLSPVRNLDDFRSPAAGSQVDTAQIIQWGGDDITNHNLPIAGGALK